MASRHVAPRGSPVAAAQLVVSGSREWALTQLGGGRIATSEKGVPLRIYRTSGKIEVRRQGNFRVIWTGDEDDTLLIRPVTGAFAGWNGKWYRGSFRIHATSPRDSRS